MLRYTAFLRSGVQESFNVGVPKKGFSQIFSLKVHDSNFCGIEVHVGYILCIFSFVWKNRCTWYVKFFRYDKC
jgi:hypothetical protein